MTFPINPPIDGFKFQLVNNTPYYSRHPVKLTFVCKCGSRIDAWADLIEDHKRSCTYVT